MLNCFLNLLDWRNFMFEGKNFINGNFVNDEVERFPAINPSTEEIYGFFPMTSKETVRKTVKVARDAFKTWSKESRIKRADLFDNLAQLIKKYHEQLQIAISTETGKNLNESHAEVVEALHMCQVAASMGRQSYGEVFASELPTKDAYVIRKPRGVVAVISPWNFPCAIGSFWCAAPALVEGNTVIHKPSELTPMVNQMVANFYRESGFPEGVFNLLHGDGNTGSALVRSKADVILFTGSAEVGQSIRKHCAATNSKTCSIECGSKSAMIIFEDGDLNLALDACIASVFKLSGQRCVSSGRILVQRSILSSFRDQFVERVENLTIGDPFSVDKPFYGPMISAEQRNRVEIFNGAVLSDSSCIVHLDGKRDGNKGFFLKPFVYSSEWGNKVFLKNEAFGPHVAIIPFDDLNEAIKIYNDTNYGLALGVVSDNFRTHKRIVQECVAGMIYINGGSVAAESHLPFSSWKKSGWGSSAAGTWKAVTHTTAVTTNYEEGAVQWAQGMK